MGGEARKGREVAGLQWKATMRKPHQPARNNDIKRYYEGLKVVGAEGGAGGAPRGRKNHPEMVDE